MRNWSQWTVRPARLDAEDLAVCRPHAPVRGGRHALKVATRVRIPLGVQESVQLTAHVAEPATGTRVLSVVAAAVEEVLRFIPGGPG